MRLDWFVPFLRKRRRDQPRRRERILMVWAKRLLPADWFADPSRGRPGRIRRTLKRIGPTFLASPIRRACQAICLIVFLGLFFYVCWPYSARPAEPGHSSVGWRFLEAEPTGDLVWQRDRPESWIETRQRLFLVDAADPDAATGTVGAFIVIGDPGTRLRMRADEDLSPAALDRLLISPGPWSVWQTEPGRWPAHHAEHLAGKEQLPAELFLTIDPLVSLSTAIASRSWVWSLACAAVILAICLLIPRGFCGYLCPLGTVIDLFDWSVAARIKRFRVGTDGWWVHLKYYLLAGTLGCAMAGVLVSGYVAAIPVITRGLLFLGEPVQSAVLLGTHQVPRPNAGHLLSIAMFLAVLGLGFLRPRFWCKYVCPSGALFSIGNLFRFSERKVESSCINCNRCVEVCPFDAIKPDFTTRTTDCTFCQTCGGVCPVHAIKFVERSNGYELKVENDPPTHETALGRRGFLSLAAGSAATVVGSAGVVTATKAFGAGLDHPDVFLPVRPPGSVPEQEFLQMCIRCGECFKACPNHVLQAEGFEQGLEGLWTPRVEADWAGCESSCNACGQVCPTGAIRALPLEEKRVARMGLAMVNHSTCLPWAGDEACQLCVDECNAAGYHAIEFEQVHTQVDEDGLPIADSGFLAPVVLDDACVGCGLCQTRCYAINVKQRHLLSASAIVVEAGPGKEDRLMSGSYVALRDQEKEQRADNGEPASSWPSPDPAPPIDDEDPFGLNDGASSF